MNRNVSIIVVILVLVVIAGYLVWIRSKYQPPVSPRAGEEQLTTTPSPTPIQSASSSAIPGAKEATASTKKAATSPAMVK